MTHWHIELTTIIGPWATFLETFERAYGTEELARDMVRQAAEALSIPADRFELIECGDDHD